MYASFYCPFSSCIYANEPKEQINAFSRGVTSARAERGSLAEKLCVTTEDVSAGTKGAAYHQSTGPS